MAIDRPTEIIDLDDGLDYERANCREKLTNMDQVQLRLAIATAATWHGHAIGGLPC